MLRRCRLGEEIGLQPSENEGQHVASSEYFDESPIRPQRGPPESPRPCIACRPRLFNLPMNTRFGIAGIFARASTALLPLLSLLLIGVRRVS